MGIDGIARVSMCTRSTVKYKVKDFELLQRKDSLRITHTMPTIAPTLRSPSPSEPTAKRIPVSPLASREHFPGHAHMLRNDVDCKEGRNSATYEEFNNSVMVIASFRASHGSKSSIKGCEKKQG